MLQHRRSLPFAAVRCRSLPCVGNVHQRFVCRGKRVRDHGRRDLAVRGVSHDVKAGEGNPGLEACMKPFTLVRRVSVFFPFHGVSSSCLPVHFLAALCPPLRC
ncbi:hypothetical protein D9M72_423930 [compost metagenome]